MRLTILGAIALAILVAMNLSNQGSEAQAFTPAQDDDKFVSGRWPDWACAPDLMGDPNDKPAKEQMLVCDIPNPASGSPSASFKLHLAYANEGLWLYDPEMQEAASFQGLERIA